MIKFSAPGKVHLLGEHAVVYGKPALLATVDLRVTVSVILRTQSEGSLANASTSETSSEILRSAQNDKIRKVIEPIVKKHFSIKAIPPYQLNITSQLPLGAGLGSSAAISASYIAALLSFLKMKWDLNLINNLTYEAEKVFHGNPSGADNAAVVFGGLIWYRKEIEDVKLIQQLPFSIPNKLAKNFILINTGKPKETTKEMVGIVSKKFKMQSVKFKKIFDMQEELVREFAVALKEGNEERLIKIIKMGEKNLESMGVVSKQAASIIRKVETIGGAAKICGGGGKTGPTGVLLCYHLTPSKLLQIAKQYNLEYFKTALGVEGLRKE